MAWRRSQVRILSGPPFYLEKNMKILTNFPPRQKKIGGIAKHINALIEAIALNEEFELLGVSPDFSSSEASLKTISPNCTKIRQPLCGLDIDKAFRARTINGFRDKVRPYIEFLENVISDEKPDLILINGTYWYPWALLEAASKFDIPIIHYYAGSLKRETSDYPKSTQQMFFELELSFDRDIVLEHFFPSELALKSVQKDVFEGKLENTRVIYNGVNMRFSPVRQPEPYSVGLIGRWTSVKNFDFIFDLYNENKANTGKLSINVVTDIAEGNKRFDRLSKVCNLHAPMDFEYLTNFYSKNCIIICPSHFETFGNVALEALSHGTPALVSNNMGVAEVFRKLGLDDWVIDFSDTKMVYEKILSLQGQCVPPKVVQKIRSDFSFETVYQLYLDVFVSYKE